jgi:hypothetical protein
MVRQLQSSVGFLLGKQPASAHRKGEPGGGGKRSGLNAAQKKIFSLLCWESNWCLCNIRFIGKEKASSGKLGLELNALTNSDN